MKKWVMAGGAVLALGVTSPAAFAVEDRFDYFELQGTRTGEIDGAGMSADVEEGISLEAAKSANDVVFIRGQVDTYNFDAADIEVSGTEFGDLGFEGDTGVELMSIGPGIGLPLGDWAHVYGQVSYERLSYFGNVGNGGGAEVGATVGPEDGVRVGVSARQGEPSFTGDDVEYELYEVDGRLPVGDTTDLVLSYQEGTFETADGDVDLNEVVGVGVRLGF